MVYMGGKGKNNSSRSNQTSHFGIVGVIGPILLMSPFGPRTFRLQRATNKQMIPLRPVPGYNYMQAKDILSRNPAGSGGTGKTALLVARQIGPCNCAALPAASEEVGLDATPREAGQLTSSSPATPPSVLSQRFPCRCARSQSPTVTDSWCDTHCNATPPNCPSELCYCSPPPAPVEYPEYFAYFWGTADPLNGNLWCGNPSDHYVRNGCVMAADHQTVFIQNQDWTAKNYMYALDWAAKQPKIKNVFISMNFTRTDCITTDTTTACIESVTAWQKTHKKIKAIYIADEPILNETPVGDLVKNVKQIKVIPAFCNVKFFVCFATPSLKDPATVTAFLKAFHDADADIDWVGFDFYLSTHYGTISPQTLMKSWNHGGGGTDPDPKAAKTGGYLNFADTLKVAVDGLPWVGKKPRYFVVPQLNIWSDAKGNNTSALQINQLTSFMWNKLIINWGLINNAVAIIPFMTDLNSMGSPAYVSQLEQYSFSNFKFLEETRHNVENGEGLQKCDQLCAGPGPLSDSMYPLSVLACADGNCGTFYRGGNDGYDYCCASTYKKGQGWVASNKKEKSTLCCRASLAQTY